MGESSRAETKFLGFLSRFDFVSTLGISQAFQLLLTEEDEVELLRNESNSSFRDSTSRRARQNLRKYKSEIFAAWNKLLKAFLNSRLFFLSFSNSILSFSSPQIASFRVFLSSVNSSVRKFFEFSSCFGKFNLFPSEYPPSAPWICPWPFQWDSPFSRPRLCLRRANCYCQRMRSLVRWSWSTDSAKAEEIHFWWSYKTKKWSSRSEIDRIEVFKVRSRVK